jgi:hypothetical protein
MAEKTENLNLYAVRVRGKAIASQIEARSDEEAVAEAVKCIGDPDGACSIVSKEPVYERGVGVECCEDRPESAVFEIRVRGTDGPAVDAIANAIYAFIGGPGVAEKDMGKVGAAEPLRAALSGMMAFI